MTDAAIFCNPDNINALRRAMREVPTTGGLIDSLLAVPVFEDRYLPRRLTHTQWNPPASDRFSELGPEDEAWARPLGIGTVTEVDDGPAFYMIDHSRFEFPIIAPRYFMGGAV